MNNSLNSEVEKLIQELGPQIWYTCYSQLISRICHPNPSVASLLQKILVKIMVQFPQQALWGLIAVTKSQSPARKQKAQEVIVRSKTKRKIEQQLNLLFPICLLLGKSEI